MTTTNPKLIQCGDHQLAPWAVTCIHVCDGTASDVLPIPQDVGSETENDWLCTDCFEKFAITQQGTIENLRVVCIHCLRKLLRPYQTFSGRTISGEGGKTP